MIVKIERLHIKSGTHSDFLAFSVQNNIVGLVAAVIVAQVIDYIWYSGMLAWQPALERDLLMTVVKDVILAVASFVIYELVAF